MKKPIQYLLVGFPYSGKTTLAKELEKRLGFAHINIDQLKFDRGFTDVGDDEVPDEVWNDIFNQADSLILEYLTAGKNVANEYAWITKAWRDRARQVAAVAGFATKVIYLQMPPEIIRQRWLANSQTHTRFHWPKEELDRTFTDFEEPTPDEDIVYFDQAVSLDDWLKKNLL